MANKQFDQVLREQPNKDDYASARKEVGEILKGRTIPADWVALFKFAYLQGVKDARSGATGEQTEFSKIAETLAKTDIQKTTGVTTMSNAPTKTDWAKMQQRLEELNELVQKNLDGTVGIEKLDTAGLVKIIRDVNQPMTKRNRATEVLLAKCNNDPVEFTRLVKG